MVLIGNRLKKWVELYKCSRRVLEPLRANRSAIVAIRAFAVEEIPQQARPPIKWQGFLFLRGNTDITPV